MLRIRKEQLDDIRRMLTLRQFEDEMVFSFRKLAPRRCELFGEARLRRAIRFGCSTAGEYGFTKRGPVRLVLELAFMHGSFFSTDPLHDWGRTLRTSEGDPNEMVRAEHLRQSAINYGITVLGANGISLRSAIQRFHKCEAWNPPATSLNLEEQILATMRNVYPERWWYLGEPRLRAFVRSRRELADRARTITPQDYVAELWSAYWAGNGFANDPLFPWTESTNRDSQSPLGEERTQKLVRFCRQYTEAMMQDWERRSHNAAETA